MPKYSIEQANELLQLLQVDAEVVAESKDADADVDVSEQANSYFASASTKLPKETLKEMEKAVFGRFTGTLRSLAVRNAGLQSKDIADKTPEEIMLMVKQKMDAKVDESGKEQLQQWENSRTGYEQEIADLQKQLESKDAEWKPKVQEWERKYQSRDIDAAIRSELDKYPSQGGNKDMQTAAIRRLLESQGYEPKYNDALKTVEYFKDNKKFKPAEVLNPIMEGIIPKATDMRHKSPASALGEPPKQSNQQNGNIQVLNPMANILAGEE